VGFVYSWDSKDKHVGKGEQEIVNIIDGERMDVKLRFKIPFESEEDAYLTTTGLDSTSTQVTWGFKGAFPYPMNIMGLFMDMDKEVGDDLMGGLTNLKELLEKQ
jgi:hypothetical protein